MKKLNLEQKISEIHIDEVTPKDVIVAMEQGKVCSMIIHLNGTWNHVIPGDAIPFEHEKLSVCLNDVINKSEGFHVL